ncbi:MAG: response regulator transcription factor [Proteobacteria bacterium]|nr:response regulator transcription factor [Pseudomonadota bacterium]
MIAHRTPVVCAGLEAALRAQGGDFEIGSLGPLPGSTRFEESQIKSDRIVVIADCETGMQLAISRYASRCRVLIMTQDDTEASIRRAMEAGIRGYLLLTSTLDAVVRAIRCVHDGGTALDPAVAAKMVDSFAGDPLTSREVDVLGLLMLGLSDKEIAKRLERSVGTVKTHLKALRAKLNASSRTEAVAIAQRRGLLPGAVTVKTGNTVEVSGIVGTGTRASNRGSSAGWSASTSS